MIRSRNKKNVAVIEWLIFLLRIWEIPGADLGPETGYLDHDFRRFSQSRQANAGIVPSKLGHNCFLANPSQFIIHLSPLH
jgi:hypothetical protein